MKPICTYLLLRNAQINLLPDRLTFNKTHGPSSPAPTVLRANLVFQSVDIFCLFIYNLVHDLDLADEGLIEADLSLPKFDKLRDVGFELVT